MVVFPLSRSCWMRRSTAQALREARARVRRVRCGNPMRAPAHSHSAGSRRPAPTRDARGQTQTHIVRCARPQTAHVRHNFGLRVCVPAAFSSANLAATAALKPVSSARHLSPLALSDYSPTTRSGWAAPDAMARWSFKVVRRASGLPPTVHVMLKPPEATRSAFADADVARPMSCPPRAAVAYVNLAKGRRMGDSRRTPMARFSTMQLRGGPIHSNADWAGVQSRASHMLSAHRLG